VLFDAIKGEKFAEKIARRIMGMIGSGELKPGDVLPPERELAGSFQVSRAVVREALGMLAVRGLVSVRQGKPTSLNDVASWNTLDPQVLLLLREEGTLRDLMELRFMVEPEAAALAAARITLDELAALRPLLDPSHNVSMDKHVEADTAYHQGIFRATHNAVLLIFMSSVTDLLRESRRLTFQAPGAIPLGAAWHNAIMDALERHDSEAARRAMIAHLQQVDTALQDFAASHESMEAKVWFPE
jgi:GntR family transcriptional repressor for pyruvate dehydrogenase complex